MFGKTVFSLMLALVSGSVGGMLFYGLGVPAPWLSGSMVGVTLAVLLQIPCEFPKPWHPGLFVILGLSMGSGVKPETLTRIHQWPISILIIFFTVFFIILATYFYQRHIAGWDKPTSYFASIPGALSFVIALAGDYPRADLSRVAISQSLRVFILIAILPLILGGPLNTDQAASFDNNPVTDPSILVLLVAISTLCGWISMKLKIPAGWLTGPFFFSSIINASGLVSLVMPDWIMIPSFIGLGALIGCRIGLVNSAQLFRLLKACFGAFLLGFGISLAAAYSVSSWIGLPFGQLLLAYAPGGLEAMIMMAFILDLDPAFVAAHQLVRYIGMILILPFLTQRLLGSPGN